MEGCAIDNRSSRRHQHIMRYLAIILLIILATSTRADPRVGHCSSEKWGHSHCIRSDHFVYDTCKDVECCLISAIQGLACAARVPWKQISGELGVDRTTAWRRWQLALTKIASRLNA